MALPLLDPLRALLQASLRDAGTRAATTTATLIFAAVALTLLVSAGLVALAQAIGYPAAAVIFATGFGLVAVAVHFAGRQIAARQRQRVAIAGNRARSDLALAVLLTRPARPFVPLLAFVVAFALSRRR